MSLSSIDMSAMISGMMNSKLTAGIPNSSERESRGMPNSTRRAFESAMRADAAVSRMAALNMRDATAFVETAQSSTTLIKSYLTEMRKITIDAAEYSDQSPERYEGYTDQLKKYAEQIVALSGSTNLNGFSLLNGSVGTDGVMQLQAGSSSIDQKFTNMLNTHGGGTNVLGANGEIDMGQLAHDDNVKMDGLGDVQGVQDMLDRLIATTQAVEAQYSYDIKSLENLSTMFESQADIFELTSNDHKTPVGGNPEEPAPEVESRAYLEYLLSTMDGAGIINSQG